MQIITMSRRDGMTLMLDLLKQLDPDRAGNVTVTLPESALVEGENIVYRQALQAIANGVCVCDDYDVLCAPCLAKDMLEPMQPGRVAEVFRVPLGAVPSVAGAVEGGSIFDD